MLGNLFSSYSVLWMSGAPCKLKYLCGSVGWRRGPLRLTDWGKLPGGGHSMCVLKQSESTWTLCMLWEPSSWRWCSNGNWRQFTSTQPPYYLFASRKGLCAFFNTFTEIHMIETASSLHWHMPVSYLAHFFHYTPLMLPTLPAARKKTPAFKVTAPPASLHCCIKASLRSQDNALFCFLIICLHHRMHFTPKPDSLWKLSFCPWGTSQRFNPPTQELSEKILHLWKFWSRFNFTICATTIDYYYVPCLWWNCIITVVYLKVLWIIFYMTFYYDVTLLYIF